MIKSYDYYTNEMTKGRLDKIFFLDKIDFDVLIDIGCADGHILRLCQQFFPNKFFIGFDNDIKMLERAMYFGTPPQCDDAIHYYNKWDDVVECLELIQELKPLKICVVFNSVLHEMFHYLGGIEAKKLYDKIVDVADTVVIRDMCLPDAVGYEYAHGYDIEMLMKHGDPKKIADFQAVYGGIYQLKHLSHFLLKYRYDVNWDREVKENYFAASWFLNHLAGYRPRVLERFTPGFINDQCKKDFKIPIRHNTHIKMIIDCDPDLKGKK